MAVNGEEERLGERLGSWKEIAGFFGKDESTVKRWEKQRSLPVHRLPGKGRGGVFAYGDELAKWLKGSALEVEDTPAEPVTSGPIATEPAELAAQASFRKHQGPGWMAPVTVSLLLVLIALAIWLRPGHLAFNHRGSTVHHPSREAQDLYFRGRYAWNRRTPESLTQAVDYFTQAIVRDPEYAAAYAGLADCYNLLREYTPMPGSEAYPRAIAAAKRAIALDDSLAEAYTSLGFAEFAWSWDIGGALRDFQKSLALEPKSAQTHHWYATTLMATGRYGEALAQIDEAQKLEPGSAAILADKGLILFHAGRGEEALALLLQVETLDPDFLSPHDYLGWIYLARHEDSKYLDENGKAGLLAHDTARLESVAAGKSGLARAGETEMLREMLTVRKTQYEQGGTTAYDVARISALLNRTREALEYLERSYNKHEANFLCVRSDETLRSLYGEQSFQRLLARMGMPRVG